MVPIVLKFIHILGAMLFLGAGAMTAYYKLRANRCPDLKIKLWYHREMVLADYIFTAPSAVILPVTGLWLVQLYGLPYTTPWILWPIIGFILTGLLWLPAVYLQIKMRNLVEQAVQNGTELSPEYARANFWWVLLGIPAFLIAIAIIWIMTAKSI